MLSVGVITGGGVGYYLSTVGAGVDDYYVRTSPGVWVGTGAAFLELAGIVDSDQVDALADGVHPQTHVTLGTRMGKVAAFDWTFSAPKTVSVLAELAPDAEVRRQVVAAHRAAVGAAIEFAESEGAVAARRGHAGESVMATTGMVAAAFEHRTSRAGDPQLHTHLLVFNRALGLDGKWSGIYGRRVFAWAKTVGYTYQAALRAELTERLGVDWTPVVNGTAEIAGVPKALVECFSTRRAAIETALLEAGQSTARSAQVATLATRPAKPEPIDADSQRHHWTARALDAGVDLATFNEAIGRHGDLPIELDVDALAAELAGPDGLTRQRSAFDRRDAIQAVAAAHPRGVRPESVSELTTELLDRPEFAATGRVSHLAGPFHSTVELLDLEARVLAAGDRPNDQMSPVCPADVVERAIGARPELSDEQAVMVRALCGRGRPVQVVIGRAGTGKTWALDTCRQAWSDAGITVIGTALAARTAAGLEAGTGIASATVDQLLADIARPRPHGGLPRRSVLVIDEAGMVGTRKLAALLGAAETARCRVILVGDPRQLPEVEAGGAFAALAHPDRHPIELVNNRRQSEPWERDALDQLRHGDVRQAIAVYRDNQRIHLADNAAAAFDALVGEWWTARQVHGPDQTVMIALTHADVEDLNLHARHQMDAAGYLTRPSYRCAVGTEFAVGDEVMCLRNDRRLDVTNGTRATVFDIDHYDGRLGLRRADGSEIVLPGWYADSGYLTHGYAMTAHKSQGMTVTQAFVLGSDRMYREAGYTSMSRATTRTDLFCVTPTPSGYEPAVDPHDDLARLLSRTGAQELAKPPLDRRTIRDAALADPGPHLVEHLGPPPAAGPARTHWAAAATAIDTYRQRHHLTGPDPLGPKPSDRDQSREWDHARALTAIVERDRTLTLEHDLGHGL